MDRVRSSILVVLVIGALLLGACVPSAPPPAIEKPSTTPTAPGTLPVTPTPAPAPTPTPTPSPTVTSAAAQLQVHFINVGQGDAILIDYGTVEVLIDGGETSPGVVPYLRKYVDGDLEAMVATHPHADHIGGLIDVLRSFQVDNIYWNGETATTKVYGDFMALAKAVPKALLQQLKRGDTINVDGLAFAVLNPPGPSFKETNDNSIVLKLKYGDNRFLFEGDAQQEAESSMLAAGLNMAADILKVGHHGSRSASSMPFLKAVSPQIAVYMAGINNSYGHPHAETLAALNQVGAKIYGTDIHGTIVVTTDGQKYTLTTEKQAPPRAPPTSTPTTTPTPTPTSTPTPTPTPIPTNELTLEIVSMTSPVSPGVNATLVAKATPGAQCDITVYYGSGPSTAQGLYPKTADTSGNVSWTWKVGTRTTPGSWRIVVTASLGGKTVSQTTYFTVQ
jgi:beta-lactamase superfamily II metal-dependent hydrolase